MTTPNPASVSGSSSSSSGSSGSSGSSSAPSKKSRKKELLADTADKYAMYLESVQMPEHEIKFFLRAFKDYYPSRLPCVLREDFCGTAAVCIDWVKSTHTDRVAYGVDLDPEPLAWGQKHLLDDIKESQRARVHFIEDDVRKVGNTPPADIIAAQNFSFFIFKTRAALVEYFKAAYQNITDEGGILVMDMMGGSQLLDDDYVEERNVKVGVYAENKYACRYVWEQVRFDPMTNDILFHIHFEFKDGSRMDQAFTYSWRLWFLPEVRELLTEAGFDDVAVYTQGVDKDGDVNGIFRRRKEMSPDPAWLAYVVAIKKPREPQE